eukprot:785004-Amphidinium_carterae.1
MELLHGGVVGGQHMDPVSYLIHALTVRFAPLEEEARLRSTNSLLGFTRMSGETIDALLSRFELVRMRAQQEGGGMLGVEPLTLILLRAVGVSHQQFAQLVQPLGGRLPQNDNELQQLTTSLRRMGHIFERYPHNIATGLHGQPTHHRRDHHYADEAGPFDSGENGEWYNGGWPTTDQDEFYYGGAQLVDSGDEYLTSTETSLDGGADAESYLASSIVSAPDQNSGEWLYLQYTKAKQAWRRHAGKPPRRFRRSVRKGKGKGKTGQMFWSEAWSFLSKGKGKGKKGPPRRGNPMGKDGIQMRCHRCGSVEHLVSRCPMPPPPGQQQQQQACHSAAEASSSGMPAMSSRPADVGHLSMGRGHQAGVLLSSHLATMTDAAPSQSQPTASISSSWRVVDALSTSWQSSETLPHEAFHPVAANVAMPATPPPSTPNYMGANAMTPSPWPDHRAAAERLFMEYWSPMRHQPAREYPPSDYPFSAGSQYQAPARTPAVEPRTRAASAPTRVARREVSRQTARRLAEASATAQRAASLAPPLRPPSPTTPTGPTFLVGALQGVASAVQASSARRANSSSRQPHLPPQAMQTGPFPETTMESPAEASETSSVVETPVHYDGDMTQCALCLSDFEAHQRVCRLPCRHVFHTTCFEQLLNHHNGSPQTTAYPSCPNCRGSGRIVAMWNVVPVTSLDTPREQAGMVTPPARSPMHSDAEFSTPQPEGHSQTFAWMPVDLAYLASTSDAMGLLVDPGSWGNLSGDRWIAEAGRRAEQYGKHLQWEKRATALRVGGVGKTTDEVEFNATVPVTLIDSMGSVEEGSFKTPVLEKSHCPALLGLQSLTQLGAVLDLKGRMLHVCGESEVEMKLPPGSRSYPLYQAPSGHLHLRIDQYEQAERAKQAAALSPAYKHLLADHLEPPEPPPAAHDGVRQRSKDEQIWRAYAAFRNCPSRATQCCNVRCDDKTKLHVCSTPHCNHQSCPKHGENREGEYYCSCCTDDIHVLSRVMFTDHGKGNRKSVSASSAEAGTNPTSS